MAKLTTKQRLFVQEYLQSFNATDAARKAGYSEKTASAIGYENLRKPEIQALIDRELENKAISADEALAILATQAQGSIGDFLTISPDGRFFEISLAHAQQAGVLHLVKKIKQRTTTTKQGDTERIFEVELYDAQGAIDKILRAAGAFQNTLEIKDNPQSPLMQPIADIIAKVYGPPEKSEAENDH